MVAGAPRMSWRLYLAAVDHYRWKTPPAARISIRMQKPRTRRGFRYEKTHARWVLQDRNLIVALTNWAKWPMVLSLSRYGPEVQREIFKSTINNL